MATINIVHSHSHKIEEARKRAQQFVKDMEGSLGLRYQWDGDQIKFDAPSGSAKGMTGIVYVEASALRLEANLPVLLRAAKGTFEAKFKEKLDSAFG